MEKTKRTNETVKRLITGLFGIAFAVGLGVMGGGVTANAETLTGTYNSNGGLWYSYDTETKTVTFSGYFPDGVGNWGIPATGGFEGTNDVDLIQAEAEKVCFTDVCNTPKRLDICFRNLKSLKSSDDIDFSGIDLSTVEHISFRDCTGLEEFNCDVLADANLTNLNSMFVGCTSLKSVDFTGLDTSNVDDINFIFEFCKNLISVNFSSCDFSSLDLSGLMTVTWSNGCSEICSNRADAFLRCYSIDESCISEWPEQFQLAWDECKEDNNEDREKTASFVSRMYTVALGRDYDENGLDDWTLQLLTLKTDGAGIANGFINSTEFTNRNLSDEEYVDVLYKTFFDRDADEGGKADWLRKLSEGYTRQYVLAGFVNSEEFGTLCLRYEIRQGTMEVTEEKVSGTSTADVRSFVERLYTKALGRDAEEAGAADWTNRIETGIMSAEDVAKSFFISLEYTNKNTDDATYVETLYQTFMDRASDESGKAYWLEKLSSGSTRKEIIEGFARSEEFSNIMASYGL